MRYRIQPVAGVQELGADAVAGKSPNYLFDELPGLLAQGPIEFKLTVQVAAAGDVTNDNTVKWPEERKVVELGTISLGEHPGGQCRAAKANHFRPYPSCRRRGSLG